MDNKKMVTTKTEREGVQSIHVDQDKVRRRVVVNMKTEPSSSIKRVELERFCDY
jgi:hypothetical protein